MTTVVALPGDHAPWQDASRRLQVDMGYPTFVDDYWLNLSGIGSLERAIVYCYSAGAVELANHSDDPRIVGAIIYEGEQYLKCNQGVVNRNYEASLKNYEILKHLTDEIPSSPSRQ